MLGTVDCLVITLFTNHIDVKFGAIAGTAIIVPGPGVTDVVLGNQTLVCSNGKLGVRFGWQLTQRGCQQEKGLFDQSNDCHKQVKQRLLQKVITSHRERSRMRTNKIVLS